MMIKVPSNAIKALFKISFDMISKWLVGSSITKKFTGDNKSLHKQTRALSPPDKTPIFLFTSSLENKKEPSISRIFKLTSPVMASSIVWNTVLSGSKKST